MRGAAPPARSTQGRPRTGNLSPQPPFPPCGFGLDFRALDPGESTFSPPGRPFVAVGAGRHEWSRPAPLRLVTGRDSRNRATGARRASASEGRRVQNRGRANRLGMVLSRSGAGGAEIPHHVAHAPRRIAQQVHPCVLVGGVDARKDVRAADRDARRPQVFGELRHGARPGA